MRVSATVATYRGHDYVVDSRSDDSANLALDEAAATTAFPDEIRRGERSGTPWVKVPLTALDRLARVRVVATWRGQEVQLIGQRDDRVSFAYTGPPDFARDNDLQGSQYDGWQGSAPADELSDPHETVTELDL